jgi:hypothetical protein
MKRSEVIVVFYERREAVVEVLEKCGAVPASGIDDLIPFVSAEDSHPVAAALTS